VVHAEKFGMEACPPEKISDLFLSGRNLFVFSTARAGKDVGISADRGGGAATKWAPLQGIARAACCITAFGLMHPALALRGVAQRRCGALRSRLVHPTKCSLNQFAIVFNNRMPNFN
jgi:hypothetical protein